MGMLPLCIKLTKFRLRRFSSCRRRIFPAVVTARRPEKIANFPGVGVTLPEAGGSPLETGPARGQVGHERSGRVGPETTAHGPAGPSDQLVHHRSGQGRGITP